PLVNVYKTSDARFLSLCMLQAQKYWASFCKVADRADLIDDARFSTDEARARNAKECIALLDTLFATRTLADWRERLRRQDGQWEVVQHVGEIRDDPQVRPNAYLQTVKHDDGQTLDVVSVPMQFDGAALKAKPAPAFGADSDAVLAELGYDEQAILDLKIA